MYQSGRVGDEAKKRKSPAKSGRVGITVNCLQLASNVLMYADDTVIYYSASDAIHILQVLNDEVRFFLDWSNKSDLFIHPLEHLLNLISLTLLT